MKRPAIQLYFGDLLKNPRVLRCSWGARGVLIWTMSILHDSDEYGAVRWPLTEIAQAVGCQLTLVKELAFKGALKGGDKHVDPYRWAPSHAGKRGPEVVLVPEQEGPLWYSSRMVRDEYKRTSRGIGTRFKPVDKVTNRPPHDQPTHANGDAKGEPNSTPSQREGDGASSSSSSISDEVRTESTRLSDSKPEDENRVLNTEKSKAKTEVNGRAKWQNQAYVAATSITVDRPRRPNESFEDWSDRVHSALDQRMREEKAKAERHHA